MAFYGALNQVQGRDPASEEGESEPQPHIEHAPIPWSESNAIAQKQLRVGLESGDLGKELRFLVRSDEHSSWLEVEAVPESLASVGLQVGDRILRVNGVAPEGNPELFYQMLKNSLASEILQIEVARGETIKRLSAAIFIQSSDESQAEAPLSE